MPFSLESLMTPVTRDEALASLLSIADSLGLNTSAWQPGSVGRTVLAVVAQKYADFTITTSEAVKGGLRRYASGGWLDLFNESMFDVERNPARFATGSLNLVNAGAVPYGPYDAGALTFAHATTRKTYKNQNAIGAGAIVAAGTTAISVIAYEAGDASNAGPGEIRVMVTPLIDVTCTNPLSVLGGEEETDDDYRERGSASLGALSPHGPKEIFHYVATTPELSATSQPITRTNVVADPVTGEVDVYLATAAGAPTAPDVVVVQDAFDTHAEALCTEGTALASANVTIAVTGTVWVRGSSKTNAEIASAISVALAEHFQTIDIGGEKVETSTGRVDRGTLEAVIRGASTGGRVVDCELAAPAADVAMTANQVAVLGAVNMTVNQLA